MTASDWLACADVVPMVQYLTAIGRKPGAPKLRLFACACCRRAWPAVTEAAARMV